MYAKTDVYQRTDVETADKGRLIVLIYDHCIKHCNVAREAMRENDIGRKAQAILKVQEGLTELVVSLDMEKGGEIARNLNRLYDFYNRHLVEANLQNKEKNIADVQSMMESLREAWKQAIANLRQNPELSARLKTGPARSYVSMVG